MRRKRVVVLGATGSIGDSALKVAHDIPERMEIVGLAANRNAQKLAAQANKVRPAAVCLVDETKVGELRAALDYEPRIFSGESGLVEIACLAEAEMVLVAVVGTGGLQPALAAIEAGKDLAVASKEILVMAGEIVMREAGRKGVQVLPVDSEHNAIFQCLDSQRKRPPSNEGSDVRRLILTASG
jgi:1-deoxy-D-xylulose-5-phosphate reductoisomerase